MTNAPCKILLVEPDPDILEILVASLSRRFDAHITCVSDAEQCLDLDMVEPHDLVVAEMELDDAKGTRLTEQLLSLRSRPIILLADNPTLDETVEALRLGVRDLFVKPFPVAQFLDSAERALRGHQLHLQHGAKYRRMRELVRRAIRERRDLNRRIDLVCRDLVGAQRRLVHRVLELEEVGPKRNS
jgi:DNA-binding NtrC family response regulator